MRRPSVVFFDVGDTLVFDSPPIQQRFAEAARAAGFAVDGARLPEAWRAAERVGLAAYLAGGETDNPHVQRQSTAAALRVLGHSALSDMQWQSLAEVFVSAPFVRTVPPQARALLDTLRGRGVRLGIVSDWEETLPAVLQELELAPYFETVSASAAVGARKPDPCLFVHALAQMQVTASDAVHIGDWLELDVRGAQSVGMGAVLFDHAGRAPHAQCPRAEHWASLAAYLDALT